MMAALCIIGFGEAGRSFATAGGWTGAAAFDVKTDDPDAAAEMRGAYRAAGVLGAASIAEAIGDAKLILSLVTAGAAADAARAAASHIRPGTLYCDMNSVAPQTKVAAAAAIERAEAAYADVAIMAPVEPSRVAVPLLVSGPNADRAVDALSGLGFENVRAVGDRVGQASSIKMIRSVMIKGLEALSAECLLAAAAAGVSEEVVASLDAGWSDRADYNMERMLVHGLRRAEEMDEVAKTLNGLGLSGAMTRATADWQRAIGSLALAPPDGLAAKTAAILDRRLVA